MRDAGHAIGPRRRGLLLLAGLLASLGVAVLPGPRESGSQGADVFLNVTQGGSRKLGIALPEFTRISPAPDEHGFAQKLPEIIGHDLRFSGLFAVAAAPALPSPVEAIRQEFTKLQQSGAHAALRGLLQVEGPRLTVEFFLYDLTSPEFRVIANKRFWVDPLADHRRLAHRIADEIVYQFTGERGIAETKIAYVSQAGSSKEIMMIDYDGTNPSALTSLRSTSLSPTWSPTDSTVAFTSFYRGYPYVFRLHPFNPRRRGDPELISAWPGINTAPAWAPDGRSIALTLSKDGNPEIYVLQLGTSDFRRVTSARGIDTDPTWSPNGREIAFSSDRSGTPQIWVMDAAGLNARRLTHGNTYDTQPRWSPRGDTIVFTRRTAGGFDLWAITPDGSSPRPLTQGSGSNESAAWAPNARHLVFSSTRGGRAQLYTMLNDGTEQQPLTRDRGEASSPSWSPRPQ